MAKAPAAAATTTAAAAAPAPKAKPAPRGPAGIPLDAKIHLGEQTIKEEGKPDRVVPYGAKNNPKRAETKAAARFETYKNGMTVKAALEAGHKPRHLVKDQKKGYIKIEGGTPVAAA